MRKTRSHNENILNYLIRNGRRSRSSSNANYLMLYAFLYKYMSDKLKNHLLFQFGGEGDDLKMFYFTDEGKAELRETALNDLGYFFESYYAFIDQFVGDNFIDDLIKPRFLLDLKENIVFSKDNPCEEYFNVIMDAVDNQTKFYNSGYDAEQDLQVSNFLLNVAKLDIEEEQLTFQKCYDLIASSRQIRLNQTPEYITQVIERIVSSKKDNAEGVYDPFMRDASILFDVSKSLNSPIYGKESNDLHYFYSLIKAFIHEYDFNDVFLSREDAIKSMSFDDKLFDVIVSKIPNNFRYAREIHQKQYLEAPNPNKNDIKEQLISKYDLSDFGQDAELLEALDILEKKVKAAEKSNILHFDGEYESLSDSEFLFVINMINNLKEDGIMAISVSQNFLFKKSLTTLRKFLTYENNYIDTIISLPEDISRSIRPEVIIVFRKDKSSDDILFIDFSKDYTAVSSKNQIRGIFRRNLIFSDETLDRIIDVFENRKTIDKFSEVVPLKDLVKNEFNLTVSRYVDTYEGEYIRLKDLKADKVEIPKKIDELNKKIDMMMDELDINL